MNPINLEPLPDLLPLPPDLNFYTTPQDLLSPTKLLPLPQYTKPATESSSPSTIISAPQIFPLNLPQNQSFSSIINDSNFKTSLKTVLQDTPSQLKKKLPDRSCDTEKPRKKLPRKLQSVSKRRSVQHIKRSDTAPPRSSSCSKLPRRSSARPCDLADQAIAAGAQLSKEQARAIRNREHAIASRKRAKEKRRILENDNLELKNRVRGLEVERERLIDIRDRLTMQRMCAAAEESL